MYFELEQIHNPWEIEGEPYWWEWDYSEHDHVCYFKTNAKNKKRALCNVLHHYGYHFKQGSIRVIEDLWDNGECELTVKGKRGKPLFIARSVNEKEWIDIRILDSLCNYDAVY